MMRSRGFTMLELMIVLTIIAVLAVIIIPNLIRAKIAAHEAAAIAACKKIGTEQEVYRRTDWDGNGVTEYAQNIGPNGGNANLESLYLNYKKNLATGLVDESFANAEVAGNGSMINCVPRSGYVYFVQLGTSYPQMLSYVNPRGCMTMGFGICAVPLQYDLSGCTTFQMNNEGVVYKKDQGDNTIVAAYNVNPTNKWTQVE